MNRPFRGEGARLVDLAPTILAALGVPRGPAMEGEVAAVMKILVIGLDCAAPELLLRRRAPGEHPPPDGRRLLRPARERRSRRSPCRPGCAWPPARTPARSASTGSATASTTPTTASGSSTPGRSSELAIWDQVAREGERSVVIGVPPCYPAAQGQRHLASAASSRPTPTKDVYTHPAAGRATRSRALVGDYPVDVKGFRTDDKAWLKRRDLRDEPQALRGRAALHRRTPTGTTSSSSRSASTASTTASGSYHDPRARPARARTARSSEVDPRLLPLPRRGDRHDSSSCSTDDTVVLVVSDHGARRLDGGFCVNEWLIREGLLVLNQYPETGHAVRQARRELGEDEGLERGRLLRPRLLQRRRAASREGVDRAGRLRAVPRRDQGPVRGHRPTPRASRWARWSSSPRRSTATSATSPPT